MTLDPIISKEFDERFPDPHVAEHLELCQASIHQGVICNSGCPARAQLDEIRDFLAQKISEAYNKGVGDGRSQEAAICYKHQTTVDEAVQKREEEILVEVKKAIGYTSVAHQVENPSDDYVAGASDQYLTIRNKVEAITSHPPQESAEEIEWIACKKCGDEVKVPLGRTKCFQCQPPQERKGCCEKCRKVRHLPSLSNIIECSDVSCPCHQEKK